MAELFHSLRSQQRENIALRIEHPLKIHTDEREGLCVRVRVCLGSCLLWAENEAQRLTGVYLHLSVYTDLYKIEE